MTQKYTYNTMQWREIPFSVAEDKYRGKDDLVQLDARDRDDVQQDFSHLRQEVTERAFRILTGIQLKVFIMYFSFNMKQADIAKSLKADLKTRLNRMSKLTKIKSIIKLDEAYNKKKRDLFIATSNLIKQHSQRTKMQQYVIKKLKLDKDYVKRLTDRCLAVKVCSGKMQKEYNDKVLYLLNEYSDMEHLDLYLEKHMPPYITQPYVFALIKGCSKKLKESFEEQGNPVQLSMFGLNEEDIE